jgi:cyanophycinase
VKLLLFRCYEIDVLYIDKREEAADEAVLTRLKAADINIYRR